MARRNYNSRHLYSPTILGTTSRRAFLRSTGGVGLLCSIGDLNPFLALSSASAEDTAITPELVRLNSGIEPIVKLIENTPRDKCFNMMVEQLRRGLPYRQFLGALFLSGVRNIDSQPPGFGMHCVFVMHAAHTLSIDAPIDERLLPLFWALDTFKGVQEWGGQARLLGPSPGKIPTPEAAWYEFRIAMNAWDAERAERAIVSLVRNRGAHEVIEGLWHYGARDWRAIGHQAIFTANAWRTLQTIGWQHAEPTLRSLVRSFVTFGPKGTDRGIAFDNQCYLANKEHAHKFAGSLPFAWAGPRLGSPDVEVFLSPIRNRNFTDACRLAVDLLVQGKTRASDLWDIVHLAAGDIMLRRPGFAGVHPVTSANALHYAFRMCKSKETRLFLLLQGLGWMCHYNQTFARPGVHDGVRDENITRLTGERIPDDPRQAADEILSLTKTEPDLAARKAFRFAERYPGSPVLDQAARRLVFIKADESHSYKYPAAIFEDSHLVDPKWRPHMLATASYYLCSSTLPDSPVMQRAKEAIRSI